MKYGNQKAAAFTTAALALATTFSAVSCQNVQEPSPATTPAVAGTKETPANENRPEKLEIPKLPPIAGIQDPMDAKPAAFTFDMDAAVQEFYDDFPDLREKVTFDFSGDLAQANGERVYVPLKLYNARYTLIDYFNKMNDGGDEMRLPGAASYRHDDMCRQFVFDHECGHALHFNYFNKEILSGNDMECFGDCYAMIRHIQRFGRGDGFPEAWTLQRARLVGHFDGWYGGGHLTTACLQHILTLDPETLCLSPEETIKLAKDITLNHGLTDRQQVLLEERSSLLKNESIDLKIAGFALMAFDDGSENMRALMLAYLQSLKKFYNLEESTARKLDIAIDAVKTGDQGRLDAILPDPNDKKYEIGESPETALAVEIAFDCDLTESQVKILQERLSFAKFQDVKQQITEFARLVFHDEGEGMRPMIVAYLEILKKSYTLNDSTAKDLDSMIDAVKTGNKSKIEAAAKNLYDAGNEPGGKPAWRRAPLPAFFPRHP